MSDKFSERNGVLAVVNPVSLGTTADTKITTWVLPTSERVGGVVQLAGAIDVTTTVKLWKATDTNGTSSATVVTATIATTTVTGRTVLVNYDMADKDVDKPYIALELAFGASSNTLVASEILFSVDPRYRPADDDNAATVVAYG